MESSNRASPSGATAQATPRRLNTANAVTQNPQAGTRFISSCNRCRKRKIKCDAGIPSCQSCVDSKTTCEYRDASLDADVPRARIIALEQQLQHLLSLQIQAGQQPLLRPENVLVDGLSQPDFRGRLVVSGIRLACVFCRKRKIRCDGTAPCAGCRKFGKPDECSILYEEASSQGRSYTSFLEDRILKLERDLSMATDPHAQAYMYPMQGFAPQPQYGDAAADGTPSDDHVMPPNNHVEDLPAFLLAEDNNRIKDVLQELGGLSQDSPAVITNQSMHLHWNFRISLLSLAGYRDETGPFTKPLTRTIVHPLVQHYVTEIHPAAPFLCLPDLNRAAERFHNNTATADERFKVLMVISIAASAMSDHPSSTAAWNALKLFSTASYTAAYDPDTLSGVELNLLVVQFATMNPSKLNVWYIAGIVMRSCSSLGLHRESAPEEEDVPANGSPDALETLASWKKRLFWAAYGYDRLLSISSGRPCGFDENAITVSIPDKKFSTSYGKWPDILLQRLHLIRLQSRIYNQLFQCTESDSQLPDACQAEIAGFEQDIEQWINNTKALDVDVDRYFEGEIAVTKTLLYRPCRLLPARSFADLEKLQETSVKSISASYNTVFAMPNQYYSYSILARVYTAALALIYSSTRLLLTQKRGNYASPQRAVVAPLLCKACVCLTHLSQEHAVGADLAGRLIEIQNQFFEWFYSGTLEDFPAPEVLDFHLYQVGNIKRNSDDETTSWEKVMQKMLGDPDTSLDMPDKPTFDLSGKQQQQQQQPQQQQQQQQSTTSNQSQSSNIPSKRARSSTDGRYDGSNKQHTDYQQQFQNQPGMSQPAPYSQMSHYGVPNAVNQPYRYDGHDMSSQNIEFNHALSAMTPFTHLPHQPSLQSGGHQGSSLTPLQQLAATAADHTGQIRQDESSRRLSMR